ncbi:protein Ssd1p [Trichomonascus vanleenenianus]|uniref:mRNA-binding translational repressor SSD1 n=1 Tax=Trichomonascus vanleenenianus TaxID=2268995 RepID=UPI003EC9AAF2
MNPSGSKSNKSPPTTGGQRGRGTRNLHIAHRRSPSELTPLMVEQLALQQQIEMLQAQQQQILAQHHQFAQAGLLPPPTAGPGGSLMPPPTLQPPSYAAAAAPPPAGAAPFGQFGQTPPPSLYHHRRAQSSMAGAGAGVGGGGGVAYTNAAASPGTGSERSAYGHTRRHSLALSEAKKAAALAQAKRQGDATTTTAAEPPHAASAAAAAPSAAGTSTTPQQTAKTGGSPPLGKQIPTFKFPPDSPIASGSSTSPRFKGHGRSQSVQYGSGNKFYNNNSNNNNNRTGSPQRNFQFPPASEAQEPLDRRHSLAGHQRTGSRNMEGNWRQQQAFNAAAASPGSSDLLSASPSQPFIPGHRPRGSYNSSISSMAAFYQNTAAGPNQGGGQARKSLFAPYLPQASLPGLLNEGRLVAGVLRVNRKNRSDAYVSTNGLLDADIFICGSKDRNRALEGDLVAIELLEVDEVWGSKKEKEEKKKRKDAAYSHQTPQQSGSANIEEEGSSVTTSNEAPTSGGGAGDGLRRKGSLKQRPTQKKNDDVEVEGQTLLLVEEEELSDAAKPLYAGHVVAVIERVPGQMFSGTLGLLRPSSQATKDKQDAERREKGEPERPIDRPKIVWFKPTDKRVPLIAIPTEQAPKDFVENHQKYADKIFIASIKRWPITSLHPFGTLVEELGPSNDLDVEIEAILRDNNFNADAFPESVLRTIPDESSLLTDDDKAIRSDFTVHNVVALTPNDVLFDEAVHVRKLDETTFELGVHIADVTQSVAMNSPLDREAKKRASSVFLMQKDINIFPASFNKRVGFEAGKTSPTVSVVFEIDAKTFEVTDCTFKLGYINPSAVLHYNAVDQALSGKESLSPEVGDTIETLQKIANKFRQQRFHLDSDSVTPILALLNQVDDENVAVTPNIFDGKAAQQLVDEINIKVNSAVAQKLHAKLGDVAFLRRQAEPILQRLESFSDTIRGLNLEIDTSSSEAIQRSFFKIKDDTVRKALETLFCKCLLRAKYFVPGKASYDPDANYGHYYLNTPLYTHFNAPLRRYADVIVQRQLKSIITGAEYTEDIDSLSSAADYCNFKKDAAKNAQEQSMHLYLCQVLNRAVGESHILRKAVVIQVYESAFDVLIPELGIEKRVHGDQLPLVKAEFHKKEKLLELFWEQGKDSATFVPADEKGGRALQAAANSKYQKSTAELIAIQNKDKAIAEAIEKLSMNASSCAVSDSQGAATLESYLEGLITRTEKENRVQEIRVLQHVPILLRAEVGKSIPCLTVRTLNPFAR